jgi:hypothetical protein
MRGFIMAATAAVMALLLTTVDAADTFRCRRRARGAIARPIRITPTT